MAAFTPCGSNVDASAEISRNTGRLFLALLPDDRTQAALAQHRDLWRWDRSGTLYEPADWHITLHFIGPVAGTHRDELRSGLDVAITPFDLPFGQPERWPHGLAVVCPVGVPPALRQLHAGLAHALQGQGVKTDDRPYRPHVTLARHVRSAEPPTSWAAFVWHVRGYAMMESAADPLQRYRVVHRYDAP